MPRNYLHEAHQLGVSIPQLAKQLGVKRGVASAIVKGTASVPKGKFEVARNIARRADYGYLRKGNIPAHLARQTRRAVPTQVVETQMDVSKIIDNLTTRRLEEWKNTKALLKAKVKAGFATDREKARYNRWYKGKTMTYNKKRRQIEKSISKSKKGVKELEQS